jgi:hypothetical protein
VQRSYRDENGRPWLEALPPLITMLPECPRSPYPITWAEQDRLFPRQPGHLARCGTQGPTAVPQLHEALVLAGWQDSNPQPLGS